MMWGPGLPPRSRTHLGSPANWSDLCEGQILLHKLSCGQGVGSVPTVLYIPSRGALGHVAQTRPGFCFTCADTSLPSL